MTFTSLSTGDAQTVPMKILVVDDERINRMLLSHYLNKLGQTVVLAENGVEAVSIFRAEAPDLVIMDVVMPEMDGYEATRQIKAVCGDRWVPVIFTSGLSSVEEQVKGLDSGGDDYLTKPVDFTILASKIRAMQRIAVMQRALLDYKATNEQELALAQYVMGKLIRTDLMEQAHIQRLIMPASNFSGDIIAAVSTPSGILHIVLADVTGHGLSAALNAIPVVDVFYEMSRKGCSISEISRELNRKLKRLMPIEYFVATALVAVDEAARSITVWNGGAPPVLFVNRAGSSVETWRSRHMALGILDDTLFDDTTETKELTEPGQLFVFSDGLVEAANAAGEEFGLERLTQTLQSTPFEQRFAQLGHAINCFLDGHPAHDDISMLAIACGNVGAR